ncbi:MAG TPA: hypothetical protein VIV12_10490, partial [Streptosporangiaceae bacterium]
MAQTRDLIVRLGVDDAKLDQGLDAAERRVRQNISAVNKELDRQRRVYRQSNQAQNAYYREMEQAETKRARQLQEGRAKYAAIGVAGAAAGVKIAQGVSVAIHAASDMNETASKSNVVFGKFAGSVTQAFADSATAIGQSKQQATEAAATLGNLFVSMGIGQQKAAGMSVSMVKLASDMASFNNASPQETLEAIRAGLVGETEPLRRFGVNLNDAALRAEAMRLGLGKIGATLTPLQRSQAAYSLILQQTKTAQGDFARTAGGMANQERILAARQADLNAAMGKVFLPIASEVLGVVNKLPLPLAAVVGGIGKAGPAALGALPGLLSYVST